MRKELTKAQIVKAMLEEDFIKNNAIYKQYLENELSLLNKKSSKSTKTNEENIKLIELVVEELEKMTTDEKRMFTVTEILKNSEVLSSYVLTNGNVLSNSKLTYLLRQETSNENARIVNQQDKKSSLYGLI